MKIKYDMDALEYISKLSEGGLRDAISLMDKCLAYSKDLTVENVTKALGVTDYSVMFDLTESIMRQQTKTMLEIIEGIYADGKDLKRFLKLYIQFILDVNKYALGCDWNMLSMPKLLDYEKSIKRWLKDNDIFKDLLQELVRLDNDIKYSSSPKYDIEAALLIWMLEG